MPRVHDTIAALATPVGTSAIALVRISGADTLRVAAEIFGETPPPRTVRRGDYRDRAGQVLDDVLWVAFAAPQSFTGDDTVEISCHGNPFIAQKILEDLFARGCRPAEPGEFTQRAFLHGRMDLSQAEAVMDIIHARSARALAAANAQLRGALGRRVQTLIDQLLGALARIEAYIDFPEEDLPAEDREAVATAVRTLQAETARLLATSHYGEILRDGVKTVIVGPPNVGKSSLLNRLVGSDRALVSPEPGTTRDFIEERIMVGPHAFRIVDTAGLNPTPAPLERLGMQKTVERAEIADLFLIVQDASSTEVAVPAEIADLVTPSNALVVLNKTDLRRPGSILPTTPLPLLAVSALTGEGAGELRAKLVAMADRLLPETGDEGVAIAARHAHALTEASGALVKAAEMLRVCEPIELVASELRAALDGFGAIGGRIDNEQMLDHLFATFCIGK